MMYLIFSKKNVIGICILLILGLFSGSVLILRSHAGSLMKDDTVTVIVDAGHGLPDGGAVGASGTVEQEINLKIAEKLHEVLEAKGITVIMTRETESGLSDLKNASIREMKIDDMKKRMALMKKSGADLFLSIHINSYQNSSAAGLRIFYSQNFEEIKPLAESIQVRMSDVTGAKTSVVKAADKKLFLMKNPPIAAILIECGFLSNPAEEKNLCAEDYQARLAWAIADAVEKYYALQKSGKY